MSTRNHHTTLVMAFSDGSHGTVQFGSTHPGFTELRAAFQSPRLVKAWVIHGRVVQTYSEDELRALRPHRKSRT